MVLRKSFYIRWSAGRSPRVHEVNPGRDPSGCPRRLASLASLEDWRCSCLCSELIPLVVERTTLFVKELSFPQTAPN